jgi:hypothetical protein
VPDVPDDENPNEVNAWTRISESVDETLRIACARKKMSRAEGIRLAIEEWLVHLQSAGSKPGKAREAQDAPHSAQWHSLLEYILRHGDSEDQTGIRKNLEWCAGEIKTRSGTPVPTKPYSTATEASPVEITCPVCRSDLQVSEPDRPTVVGTAGLTGVPAELTTLVTAFVQLMQDEELAHHPAYSALREILKQFITEYYRPKARQQKKRR